MTTTIKQMKKMCRPCFDGENITRRATASCSQNGYECDDHQASCTAVHGEIGTIEVNEEGKAVQPK